MPIQVVGSIPAPVVVTTPAPVCCSVVGCGSNVHAKGFCTFHYNSFRNHGDPLAAERKGDRPRVKRARPTTPAPAPKPAPVVVTTPAPVVAPVVQNDEFRHPAFDEVCELVSAGENVMLVGPAGTGKSHLAEQVARALGRNFGSISCSAGMSESHLVGRMVPYGEAGQFQFLGTEFLDCFENGGVFLLDEMDSADPNVLLVINSALANGRISIPARHNAPTAKRHRDFALIAACNTFGRGADRQYVGRSQLDESTLDRFRIGTIEVDYNEALERSLFVGIAGDTSAALAVLESVWRYRAGVVAARLERCVSTRFLISAARAFARGRSISYIESKLFNGWRADEVKKVKGA
jgi:cobaltochelatase CobS